MTNIITAEATQHLCMFISGAQYTRVQTASQRLVFHSRERQKADPSGDSFETAKAKGFRLRRSS
jgi:hypothetical protein